MKAAWIALLLATLPAHAGSLFGDNKIDDIFTVRSIQGTSATLEGTPKDLKAGDQLFFARSPFKFAVTAVKGSEITIALPEKQDLEIGNSLMRKENDQVKRAMDTEKRLKQALDE